MKTIKTILATAALGSLVVAQPLAAARSAESLPSGRTGAISSDTEGLKGRGVSTALLLLLLGSLAAMLILTLDDDDGGDVPVSPG